MTAEGKSFRLEASCACGCGGSPTDHRDPFSEVFADEAYEGVERKVDRQVEAVLLSAIAPDPMFRRAFLKAVGASTVLAAISQLLPLAEAQAIAQEATTLEKTKLNVGYVPITCTVPLLLAHAMGEYGKEGLDVNLVRTPSWAIVRDKLLSSEFDASHLVLAMPLTMTMGVGGPALATHVSSVQNVNGNAITLSIRHKDRRDPKDWKGFKFGVPHQHSMHAMLLRYYLAEHGLDPDKDVEICVYPPPDSVANMAAGNLDGMLFAEPWGQRAVFEGVGFLHMLTRDIFPGHPCCVVSVTDGFVKESPNSYGAMFRAVVRATEFADKPENRKQVAELLAPAAYLNQPKTVLEQVLTGRYADGLGKVVNEPDRIGFKALPYHSTAIWLLTQLRRWDMVPADVEYRALAEKVFLATNAAKRMKDIGFEAPAAFKPVVMGRPFDPDAPQAYVDSFAIKRI
ncbi:CmpA/NrtA family ABC transporter substrate-binding protein [Methylorubrum thiocyanatum]|uniref:CmpA/NrtA family ABC transporter substrate-binding protein n=1 Tax=Methylorubrum thiocyanatum TaxID=47958 RepID=UPI00383A7D8A